VCVASQYGARACVYAYANFAMVIVIVNLYCFLFALLCVCRKEVVLVICVLSLIFACYYTVGDGNGVIV